MHEPAQQTCLGKAVYSSILQGREGEETIRDGESHRTGGVDQGIERSEEVAGQGMVDPTIGQDPRPVLRDLQSRLLTACARSSQGRSQTSYDVQCRWLLGWLEQSK